MASHCNVEEDDAETWKMKENTDNNVESSTLEDEVGVRQLLKQLADDTTLHGFKNLHDSKGARKIFWLAALIVASVLVVVLFSNTINDYFQYKTYIQTEMREDITSLQFPTVTLCFNDNFNKFKFEKFPADVTLEEYKRIFSVIHGYVKRNVSDVALFEKLNINSYEKLINSLHLNYEDTILNNMSMAFNHGRHCSFSKQKCVRKDLKMVWQLRGRHSCIQFNSYHPKKQPKHQTVIYSPFRVYIDMQSAFNKLFFRAGHFRYHHTFVYIHEYGTPHHLYRGKDSNSVVLEKGAVLPGYVTTVEMDRDEVTQLPPPHGNCGSQKLKVVKYYPYTLNACVMDCELQYVIKQCGCIRFDLKYMVDEHIPICTTSQMIRCYIQENFDAKKKSEKCFQTCPRHCRSHEFNINIKTSDLPQHHFKDVEEYFGWTDHNRTKTKQYVKENVIGIAVKYRKMKEKMQTYTPMVTLTVLLATIGGSIGLGMGLSLLTIVEFMLFIIDAVKNSCRANKCKDKRAKSPDVSICMKLIK